MKTLKYITFFAIVLGLWKCTEPFTPELDTTYKRLVIEGYVTDTTKNYVALSLSNDYLSGDAPVLVNNAIVTVDILEDTTGSVPIETIAYLEKDESGIYYPPEEFRGTPGYFYRLNISNVEIENNLNITAYTAIDYMPLPIADEYMDSISLNYYAVPQFDFWQIELWAWEPKGPNWYAFLKSKNGVALSDSIHLWSGSDDGFFDGNYTNGAGVQNVDNHDSIEWPELKDTFALDMWNISEEFYTNIFQVQQVIAYQNPLFSGPPANVYTNVSEGAVGFFASYSVNHQTTVVKHIPQEALDRREKESNAR